MSTNAQWPQCGEWTGLGKTTVRGERRLGNAEIKKGVGSRNRAQGGTETLCISQCSPEKQNH